ncbi:sorting nexin lst-4 [Phlebotomus argentipes]|uniref:sorting nexin lst-4 n=1 Tax=Phlebotomus argentipes TaxID=94469 RepID=UPI002892FE66|nr:sorting nexin lst-4 [Phlebotomus argentipes]XP_059622501.1 sorting nexin lst-4 [Phlebotomus argentipes]
MRVKALYDFSGEPNTSELSIQEGEVLTVTRTDVGEGWWEGSNKQGRTGLFPAAYVETLSEPPAVAAPVAPKAAQYPALPRYDQTPDDWNEQQDDWEDDWDDDQDTYSEIGPGTGATHNSQAAATPFNSAAALPPRPADDAISVTSTSAPVKSRSKMFSKSSDSYIMGITQVSVPENEKVSIVPVDHGFMWRHTKEPYTVRVASPKKETKFKGMKSFIAYQLTPSFNNISVSRRYKHFDWLHGRLVEKFSLIPIPPLPDKQISGRYEEQFIEHRRVQLQEFVDWMCRHPVLSSCEVWMHFLTCTDEKKWKVGKRTAEKDPLVGAVYCAAIVAPEKQLLQSQVDMQVDTCGNFVHQMDSAVKTLSIIATEQTKKYQMQWKKDFQRIGEGLSELARSLEVDERRASTSTCLSNSVGLTAGVYIGVGQLFGDQAKHDWIPLSDRLHIYKGVLGAFPDILSEHKNAMAKKRDCEKLTGDQKMSNAQLQEVNRRTDVISYAMMAELSHFRVERDEHLKETLREFIAAQIAFYQTIVSRLQAAKQFFE